VVDLYAGPQQSSLSIRYLKRAVKESPGAPKSAVFLLIIRRGNRNAPGLVATSPVQPERYHFKIVPNGSFYDVIKVVTAYGVRLCERRSRLHFHQHIGPLGDERRACPWNKLGNLVLLFKLQNKYV
jgi:hypothetical protein